MEKGMAWWSGPVFLPGEFHGQRSLAGYCPWGRKESDTTEPLTLPHFNWCFPDGSVGKYLPAVQETQETWVRSLGQEDPLEEEKATRSSILA